MKKKKQKTWPCEHIFDGYTNWMQRTPQGSNLDVPSWCKKCYFCGAVRPDVLIQNVCTSYIVSKDCLEGRCQDCDLDTCEHPNCWCSD